MLWLCLTFIESVPAFRFWGACRILWGLSRVSLLPLPNTVMGVFIYRYFCPGLRGDASLSLPVRQTASIFKQPVTVIRSHPDSKVRHDLKHGPADSQQPRQLFWERSLTGLKCSDIDEDTLRCIGLPSKIQGMYRSISIIVWQRNNSVQSRFTGNWPLVRLYHEQQYVLPMVMTYKTRLYYVFCCSWRGMSTTEITKVHPSLIMFDFCVV